MVALLVVLSFVSGAGVDQFAWHHSSNAGAESSFTSLPEFQDLQQTWDLIHQNYVDESAINDQDLIYGAAKGMVDALGDTGHSTFLTPDETKAYNQSIDGKLTGIGIEIDFTGSQPVIVSPIDNSPADKAGLKAKDIIVAVNGTSTDGQTQVQLSQELQGKAGTSVTLTIQRPGQDKTFDVTITREDIKIVPVSWAMLPGNVAHIRLTEFSDGATKDLIAAINAAKAAGATSIILDLRDNPGGLAREAVGVASQFLPEGEVIYQNKERNQDPKPIKSVGEPAAGTLPTVVLVNAGSASAAEIVTAALKDNGRATVIGEKTFGTGTTLVPYPLPDGSSVVLGISEWIAPGGETFWHKGVQPNVTVALPTNVTPDRPNDEQNITLTKLEATDDTQLLAAINHLTGSDIGTPVAGQTTPAS
jgi:carboxyl-terminal processing protease